MHTPRFLPPSMTNSSDAAVLLGAHGVRTPAARGPELPDKGSRVLRGLGIRV